MSKKKINIKFSEDEINKLIDKIESSNLDEESREKLINTLKALVELDRLVGLKSATIARLRKVFGKQSERQEQKKAIDKKDAIGKTGGSGRHGKDHYPQAKEEQHKLKDLKAKDTCPACKKGKLYNWEPGIHVRIYGNPPLDVVIHKTEKLRCNLCGKIYEADFEGKTKDKFDEQAKAIIALLHYKSSLPYYRIEKLQEKLGIPVPRSTLWRQVEKLADDLITVWKPLVKIGSNGELFYLDDTKARLLSLIRENELNKENKKARTGMYTTGILSEIDNKKIVLYFTGRKYSGENLKNLLTQRTSTEPIAIMSDALNHNNIDGSEVLKYLCLVHGRRNFIDLEDKFKQESEYIIELIGNVYKNDDHCKEQGLNAKERLEYHKKHSSPAMNELKKWLDGAFSDKKVEPNSSLGKGIKYMQRHWKGLTAFLQHPGAPLDNNIIEQQLRVPVLNRKNWLFYKTSLGAFVGDIILSIIKTCDLNDENALDYMVAVQKNIDTIKQTPQNWMPWNYKQNLN